MKKLIFSIIIILTSQLVFAQLTETFDDGDFSSNPAWTGNLDRFQVNTNFQLQLNHEGEADTSCIQTMNQFVDSTSWEFYIKLSFSPSGNNNARVYLASDSENLEGALNGYFLQFGEAGSGDAIELFKQEGEVMASICRGTEASIASSFDVRIKVEHSLDGQWLVFSDFNNSDQYILECQGNDNSIQTSNYFGFFCKYTSSNSTKFYFDDIDIKYLEVDQNAPTVSTLALIEANKLQVSFSESITTESAEDEQNYQVDHGIGSPNTALLENNQSSVILEFPSDFELDQDYQLNIAGIRDLEGNIIRDTSLVFSRIEVQEFDIVFNEIMPDPNPVIQLPDAEFIELYNRKNTSVDLSGWILKTGSTEKDFPAVSIPANGYLILCKESNLELLTPYGACAGFSSFSLTNSGQELSLIAPSSQIIHSISYTDDWYADNEKDEGGWSIEQINPNDFCSEEVNWRASIDNRGGSPGEENSIYDPSPVLPELSQLKVTDNPLLLLTFTQHMNMEDILNKNQYSVSPNIGNPSQITMADTSKSVYLSFNQDFEEGVAYSLKLDGEFRNCAGELMITPIDQNFMLNKIADPGDIVINEIMADPEPVMGLAPYEYLELYNSSSSPIDMSNWILQIGSTIKEIDDLILAPQSYILFTENEAEEYFSEYAEVYAFSTFSLTNGGTQLVLKNRDGGIIHQVEYSDAWYHDDEKADGGWSLEAIDPLDYCQEENNWSASEDDRGGSPGAINSIDGLANETEELYIERIELLSNTSLRVYFSQKMDSSTLGIPAHYEIDQQIGSPLACFIEGPQYKTVRMTLANELQKGIIYHLETLDGLIGCSGSDASDLESAFAVPDIIEKGDIVFNEILFDPAIDDGEYLELVNVSDKILETAGLSISRIKVNEYDTSWYTAELSGNLLFPMDYVAYAQSQTQVLKVYSSEAEEKILSLESFPTLPNTEGTVLLHHSSAKDSIIDQLDYNESWHHSLIKNTQGVSLEKISLHGENLQGNWHSAASSVNYGTPAYENSQFKEAGEIESKFELLPEIFSPDNDGFDDLLQINYKMDESGYTLNLLIYDSRGREVKHLLKNELLGTHGSFYWDGQNEDYQKSNMGIYILLFEYFDLDGNVKTEKLTVVLGGKL